MQDVDNKGNWWTEDRGRRGGICELSTFHSIFRKPKAALKVRAINVKKLLTVPHGPNTTCACLGG